VPTPPGDVPSPLQPLRDAIGKIEIEQTRKALLVLVDAAGNDVGKVRENIEAWFNSSMDRVSGWYKRRSQSLLLLIGFLAAVALNIDAVYLVRHLSTDKTARDSLVKAAENYSKPKSDASASSAPPDSVSSTMATSPVAPGTSKATKAAPPSARPKAAATPPAAKAATPAQPSVLPGPVAPKTEPTPTAAAASTPGATLPPPAGAQTRPSSDDCHGESPECRVTNNLREIKKLQLPIGWLDSGDELQRVWPGQQFVGKGGWVFQINQHWLGWLLTALAVSLGAPFWFDLLNKIIVVRSTVKPHEKSPEEKTKS
jgi:cell division septation protein DedD